MVQIVVPAVPTNDQDTMLIELQGSLEKEAGALGSALVGNLALDGPTPLLTIGALRLEGAWVNLAKPIAVLRKAVPAGAAMPLAPPSSDAMSDAVAPSMPAIPDNVPYELVTVFKRKCLFKSRPEPIIRQENIPVWTRMAA